MKEGGLAVRNLTWPVLLASLPPCAATPAGLAAPCEPS